jgi:hypothetical protein
MLRQVEFASAAAIVVVCGNIADAVENHGSHGYRLLLVNGGVAAQNVWLSALGSGLSGCLFEGPLRPEMARLAGTDGWRRAPLLAVAVGRRP